MRNIVIGIAILTTLQLWAHGEDKLGPHGGYITMPGPFHVEVVLESEQRLKLYLLDMDWKNPSVKDSKVTLTHDKTQADCKEVKSPRSDHFLCEFPKSVKLKSKGELSVEATREKQQGMKVKYELPLKLKAAH